MGRKFQINSPKAIYFVTFTVVNWIDVFIRDDYKKIVIDSLKYCQKEKGLNVHAWCIMTSHVHLILSVEENFKLTKVMRDIKRYISTQLKRPLIQIRQRADENGCCGCLNNRVKGITGTKDFSFGNSITIL
jgi:putative transposase